MFAEKDGRWSDSEDRLAGHFQRGFELLAGHQDNQKSLQYRKTVDMMRFPEPEEFGLGFVSEGTSGAGAGLGLARLIVAAMTLAIERGLQDLRHFEELGVLVEGIGRDRISDITCNIMKAQLIAYTQDVCRRHEIPMQPFEVKNGAFDETRGRWASPTVDLPANPVADGPVILVPRRFLRELPTLGSDDWWNYVEPTIRDDLNLKINQRLPKREIIRIAREHPEWVRQWTADREARGSKPYDLDRDPEGLHNWQALAMTVVQGDPLPATTISADDLPNFIAEVNQRFRHFVEERGGWELLYNDDTHLPKKEGAIQLLYRGVVESYCLAASVFLDREVNLGRGPVDFVFTGPAARSRVLLEIKKFRNGKFWNGLEDQLTSYLRSEGCRKGWFLAVRFTDSKTEERRWAELDSRTKLARTATGFDLRSVAVDARRPPSASEIDDKSTPTPAADDPEFPDE